MKDTKIQWHPAFVAAMGLELKQNRDDLIFEKEYNLNTKPLEIDLLIIKKAATVQVSSEIGRFFKGHNILSINHQRIIWILILFIRHWHMVVSTNLMERQWML